MKEKTINFVHYTKITNIKSICIFFIRAFSCF